jgi:hypothetical protein
MNPMKPKSVFACAMPFPPYQTMNFIVKQFADYTLMVPDDYARTAYPHTPASTIFSAHTRHLLSVAAPSPMNLIRFQCLFPMVREWVIFEMVQGTRIQLFYDGLLCKWEIATKREVGGYGSALGIPGSFRERFVQALGGGNTIVDLNSVPVLSALDRAMSYQFKLTKRGEAVLVSVFVIHNEPWNSANSYSGGGGGGTATHVPLESLLPSLGPFITFPRFVHATSTDALFEFYGSLASNPVVPGVVIQSKTGETTVIQNLAHMHVEECRSLPRMALFEYLCFRSVGQWKKDDDEGEVMKENMVRVAERQIAILADVLMCAYERFIRGRWLESIDTALVRHMTKLNAQLMSVSLSSSSSLSKNNDKEMKSAALAYVASLSPMVLFRLLLRQD